MISDGFMDTFKAHLEWAEDRRPFPYEDSVGKTTIGVGRNLDDRGLSDEEIDFLCMNDMRIAVDAAKSLVYWGELNEARRLVICDMIFNMGMRRFRGFVRTNAALRIHDYQWAADEMKDSRWYRQTGRRAQRLEAVMRSGEWLA